MKRILKGAVAGGAANLFLGGRKKRTIFWHTERNEDSQDQFRLPQFVFIWIMRCVYNIIVFYMLLLLKYVLIGQMVFGKKPSVYPGKNETENSAGGRPYYLENEICGFMTFEKVIPVLRFA